MHQFRHAVLADTSVLYALVDQRDQNHSIAQFQSDALIQAHRQVLVAYATLQEAHTLVLHRLGKSVGTRWLTDVTTSSNLIHVAVEDYQQALAIVTTYSDQTITLHDFVLSVMSKKLVVPIWTFDTDFDILQANVWRPS